MKRGSSLCSDVTRCLQHVFSAPFKKLLPSTNKENLENVFGGSCNVTGENVFDLLSDLKSEDFDIDKWSFDTDHAANSEVSVVSPRDRPCNAIPTRNIDGDTAADVNRMTYFGPPMSTIGLGNFSLDRTLGSGASGVVMAGYFNDGRPSSNEETPIALKRIERRFVEGGVWDAEVQAVDKVSAHPNISTLVVSFCQSGNGYIATELVKGPTLFSMLSSRVRNGFKGLGEMIVLKIMGDIFNALTFMHGRDVAHMDLKLENVMLDNWSDAMHNDCESWKTIIIDFGLASVMEAGVSVYSMVDGFECGTEGYHAPEVCNGYFAHGYADIYSAGVMFYFLVTGRPPWECKKFLNGNVENLGDGISKETTTLIRRCVETIPSRRPRAEEAKSEIERIIELKDQQT